MRWGQPPHLTSGPPLQVSGVFVLLVPSQATRKACLSEGLWGSDPTADHPSLPLRQAWGLRGGSGASRVGQWLWEIRQRLAAAGCRVRQDNVSEPGGGGREGARSPLNLAREWSQALGLEGLHVSAFGC